MNVLELYSGIGGMHMALNASGIEGNIVAAVEINTVANDVYSHNFPETKVLNKNIQGLTAKFINDLNVDAIFMSPPCQPFTRNGLQKDVFDPRTYSFDHILQILPDLKVKYILIENVKGFETSKMRYKLIDSLLSSNFTFQEFILSPTQVGVSNTRHRYYCLAKKLPLKFTFKTGVVKEEFPDKCSQQTDLFPIADIIEANENTKECLLREITLLKHAEVLDICTPSSRRSCCFTKGYGRLIEGTGSVFTEKSQEQIEEVYKELKKPKSLHDYTECIKSLELRFFTPREVARLMSFPETFSFPDGLKLRQKYKLLGNSINVKVVAELIKILAAN